MDLAEIFSRFVDRFAMEVQTETRALDPTLRSPNLKREREIVLEIFRDRRRLSRLMRITTVSAAARNQWRDWNLTYWRGHKLELSSMIFHVIIHFLNHPHSPRMMGEKALRVCRRAQRGWREQRTFHQLRKHVQLITFHEQHFHWKNVQEFREFGNVAFDGTSMTFIWVVVSEHPENLNLQ